MHTKESRLSKFILILGVTCAFSYAFFLQFRFPAFCDPDSYYHAAVSNFIKNYGLHYPFPWVQFSTFKDSFSDKEVLFHILNLPFFYFFNNLVRAAKFAFLFQVALFILAYVFILKRYLPAYLAAVFLLLPFSSSIFMAFLLQLRPATLGNVFILLGIYFLIRKNLTGVFAVSLLYSLAHISFFTIIIFAFFCEALRRIFNKEFFAKNIYFSLSGVALGCLMHPNFPHNLFSLYLNGFLVPIYTISGRNLGFGGEVRPFDTRFTFIGNHAFFLSLPVLFWAALLARRKVSFDTFVWLACAGVYLFLAIFGNRYWYQSNLLFFVFIASLLKDWSQEEGWVKFMQKFKFPVIFYLLTVFLSLGPGLKQLNGFLEFFCVRNLQFETMGKWMGKNIPPGETIYHSYWANSPYFICFNPKDNYINVLDPIYMFYRYPREFDLLNELSLGRVDRPYQAIRKVFKARYGYVNKFEPLYRQLNDYPLDCKVIYEDSEGVIFKLN